MGVRTSLQLAGVCAALLLTVTGCTSPATGTGAAKAAQQTTTPKVADSAYADAVAVLGHSLGTGFDSDPAYQEKDVKANSWATGTNPAVDSIYSRVVALNPQAKGHKTNLALDGSGVAALLSQAKALVKLKAPHELILIGTIDNDMKCDGTDAANLQPYGDKLSDVLDVLQKGLPDSHVFIASQFGTVQNYDTVVLPINSNNLFGTGVCAVGDPRTETIDPAKEVALQAIIDSYDQVVVTVCAAHPNCQSDGGAARNIVETAADLGNDQNHLSVAGLHKYAAAMWHVIYPDAP